MIVATLTRAALPARQSRRISVCNESDAKHPATMASAVNFVSIALPSTRPNTAPRRHPGSRSVHSSATIAVLQRTLFRFSLPRKPAL